MQGDGDLYVFSAEGAEGDGEWVSPRPVESVVVVLVTDETGLSEADVDELGAYVDRDDIAAHLDGDPRDPLTFTVEGDDVAIDPDGTVSVDTG